MDSFAKKASKAFGRRVREIRKKAGLSQEALALAADLDRSYVGQVERGEKNISLSNIWRLAAALGIEPSALLTRGRSAKRDSES